MSKIKLKIDGRELFVAKNSTVLQAASEIGLDIPTLCYLPGKKRFTSCMVCMVRDNRSKKLIPSCSALVEDGMEIITDSEDVIESRKAALELLLSEHLGDCEAQCRMICPAYMNIPIMIRYLRNGDTDKALKEIRKYIPLYRTISLICSAPCEKGCRRKRHDNSVSIKNLERYAAFEGKPEKNEILTPNEKKIAIIGSGPAGLSCAYFLILKGYQPVILEKEDFLGGGLRKIGSELLPSDVLDKDIEMIDSMGCEFRKNEMVDLSDIKQLEKLKKEFDAVVVATGIEQDAIQENFEVPSWIFIMDSSSSQQKQAIKAIAAGRKIAEALDLFFFPDKTVSEPINSRFGPLEEGDMSQFLKIAQDIDIIEPASREKGFSLKEALKEASRCLHCDCGKPDNCKLRELSTEYEVEVEHYRERKTNNKRANRFIRDIDGDIIYEPGKCIKCGICVRICEDAEEREGMTFTGRGYNSELQIPFGGKLSKGLGKVADECIDQCPTGALVKKKVK